MDPQNGENPPFVVRLEIIFKPSTGEITVNGIPADEILGYGVMRKAELVMEDWYGKQARVNVPNPTLVEHLRGLGRKRH